MEESELQDVEQLLQELEEEYGPPREVPSPDVEKLLQDLRVERPFGRKKEALAQLGRLNSSNLRIVSALVEAKLSDPSRAARKLAAESLLAPAHQEVLQQYPDLMQSATSPERDEEPSPTTSRTAQRRAFSGGTRRKPMSNAQVLLMIPVGIAVAYFGVQILKNEGSVKGSVMGVMFFLAGLAMVGWAFWNWLEPSSARNVFRRSMKETTGTVARVYKTEEEGDYGKSYKYFATVRFKADHAKLGTRVISVKFQVPRGRWKEMESGGTVGIRYAAEEPTIALIEGEW